MPENDGETPTETPEENETGNGNDLEGALNTLKKVRSEREAFKAELADARRQLADAEQARTDAITAAEQARDAALAELDAHRAEQRTNALNAAALTAAKTAGAISPEAIVRLIDTAELDPSDADGITAAIAKAAEAFPTLFVTADPGPGDAAAGKGSTPTDENQVLRAHLRGNR